MFITDKNFVDFTGQKFGRYLVIDFAETRISRSGNKVYYWLVSCQCKRRKVVSTNKLRVAKYQDCTCDSLEEKGSNALVVL